uniref:Uncharacterized protein n=2 Tax=Picea TaxID=3328 RepID=A0A101M0Z9_PICGL|nr:hypothetical protein ABT39_MTgene4376 [Picea glauca]QHR91786.1 hypothetical protein Q903MT_gene5822 [Picea sitchensis]
MRSSLLRGPVLSSGRNLTPQGNLWRGFLAKILNMSPRLIYCKENPFFQPFHRILSDPDSILVFAGGRTDLEFLF